MTSILLDTSAVLAILYREPGWTDLATLVLRAEARISAPNLVEAHIALRRRVGEPGADLLQKFLADFSVGVLPFGPAEVAIADEAHRRFGKGFHPAKLNYGDCMAYAASRTSGRALLFVGEDFALTDVVRAEI